MFNSKAVVAEAEAGRLSLSQLRKEIQNAERFNSIEARIALRKIEQRMLGERATLRLSNEHTPGSASWAFAELHSVPKTPYSWAALAADGGVVLNIWDDEGGWAQDSLGNWYPAHAYGARPDLERERRSNLVAKGTRTEFFRLLEVAVASHAGHVKAILSTAEDINAIPRKRVTWASRPWLNEDGSPVDLRVVGLDLKRFEFGFELADASKRPRPPSGAVGPRLGTPREDGMLRRYARDHPGEYYLEVAIGERRIDAVRVPASKTTFRLGRHFQNDRVHAVDAEAIEVKQGELRRNIVDQAIGSAAVLGMIPVAIVESASGERLRDISIRHPKLKVWVTTSQKPTTK